MLLNELPQRIEAKTLSEFIPHSGPMILLDWIEEWDDDHIVCTTRSHLNKNNPLRINNVLSVVHSIEYAAQAVSFHSVLMSLRYKQPPEGIARYGGISTAFLAIVRDFQFEDVNMDAIDDALVFHAHSPANGPRLLQYKISAEAMGKTLARGLITLVIEG